MSAACAPTLPTYQTRLFARLAIAQNESFRLYLSEFDRAYGKALRRAWQGYVRSFER